MPAWGFCYCNLAIMPETQIHKTQRRDPGEEIDAASAEQLRPLEAAHRLSRLLVLPTTDHHASMHLLCTSAHKSPGRPPTCLAATRLSCSGCAQGPSFTPLDTSLPIFPRYLPHRSQTQNSCLYPWDMSQTPEHVIPALPARGSGTPTSVTAPPVR